MSAPWLYPNGLTQPGFVESYEDEASILQCNIPSWVATTLEWKRRVAVPAEALATGRNETEAEVRARHFGKIYRRYVAFLDLTSVPAEYEFDPWVFRSESEKAVAVKLNSLWASVPDWHNCIGVHQDALPWDETVIPLGFRCRERRGDEFFDKTIRFERRARSQYGVLVPYQNTEVEYHDWDAIPHRYAPLPAFCASVEVLEGFWAELGPTVTYLGLLLTKEPLSGWWEVVLTKWAASLAATLFWEVYATDRLWFLPSELC